MTNQWATNSNFHQYLSVRLFWLLLTGRLDLESYFSHRCSLNSHYCCFYCFIWFTRSREDLANVKPNPGFLSLFISKNSRFLIWLPHDFMNWLCSGYCTLNTNNIFISRFGQFVNLSIYIPLLIHSAECCVFCPVGCDQDIEDSGIVYQYSTIPLLYGLSWQYNPSSVYLAHFTTAIPQKLWWYSSHCYCIVLPSDIAVPCIFAIRILFLCC